MTVAVAASVGANRVTFDLSRQAVVWIDGHAGDIGTEWHANGSGPGTFQELTSNSWTIRWDSGETLLVTE